MQIFGDWKAKNAHHELNQSEKKWKTNNVIFLVIVFKSF